MFLTGFFVGSCISALWIYGVFINAGRAQLLSLRLHVGFTESANNIILPTLSQNASHLIAKRFCDEQQRWFNVIFIRF